ncbi:hypothetical protein Salat_0841800 [Sesamum alatum]|uniref:Uncharacterized protein n=1 Tax=Sesamum alatum TaxID=300844 RepID=A0AAE1YJ74_9LAMI|nr:hypothetical protein Salat_0841800 [Sesamum alatum]
MSEEDKLFIFFSGFQTWAQTELRHQGVKDLSFAIATADRLVDFRITSSADLGKKKESGREKAKSGKTGRMTKNGCYLCNDDHRMRDRPKRRKLNGVVAEVNDDDDEGGSS